MKIWLERYTFFGWDKKKDRFDIVDVNYIHLQELDNGLTRTFKVLRTTNKFDPTEKRYSAR